MISVIDTFLAVYFLLIGVLYTARALALKHRVGATRIHYGPAGSGDWWRRWVFNLFRLLILSYLCLRIPFSALDQIALTFWLDNILIRTAGMFTLLISMGLICYIHSFMHNDWHSGINRQGSVKIITSGPFSKLRHPLFASVMLGMLGLFLALPSLFTLVSLLVGVATLYRQAKAEEKFLASNAEYSHYARSTPAWNLFATH